MLDSVVRPLLERLHRPMASRLRGRVHPNSISLIGFALGMGCALALAMGRYMTALVLWGLNRGVDGLDGTLARSSGTQSDFGGFLDIMLDFTVYAAIPIGLVLGLPDLLESRAYLPLALLLASFYVNSASWMYPAALIEKRGRVERSSTSVVMPAGLIEATETVVLYALLILLPRWAPELMSLMALLVFLTAAQRVSWARTHLR